MHYKLQFLNSGINSNQQFWTFLRKVLVLLQNIDYSSEKNRDGTFKFKVHLSLKMMTI